MLHKKRMLSASPAVEIPSGRQFLPNSVKDWLKGLRRGSIAIDNEGLFAKQDFLLNVVLACWINPVGSCTSRAGNEPSQGTRPPSVLVSLNPSNSARSNFASQGYTNTQVFFVLPSLNSPRWLFPLGDGHSTLGGLQIYMPYAKGGRILKGLLTTLVVARCQWFASHRVLVVSRGDLPLEGLVREVTGERHPVFSLSVGAESPFRKLTVQVMRPDGEILGYIKLPLTEAAVQFVRHEAETLNRLWSFPALRPHIPRVLYSGERRDSAILFQSAGPPRRGPVPFNNQCEEFLQLLRRIRATQKPGQHLWEEVAARWRKAEQDLGPGWQALGNAALARSKRELEGVMVPYCVAHGDFVPWNTRTGDGRLYVFDWEYASWHAPASWDAFHFKTQVGACLKKKDDICFSNGRLSGERASFLLYLLNSVCQPFGEDRPAKGVFLDYRRRLLEKELGRI